MNLIRGPMPNGHGGFVRFFSPIVLLLFLAGVLARRFKHGDAWTLPTAYVLAAMVAERLAWHLHMWNASEYGGGYTSAGEAFRAWLRYGITALILVSGALFLVSRLQ